MKAPKTDKRRETRIQAKAWMVLNKIRNVDIEEALEMKSHTLVTSTLAGTRNNHRVLRYLLDRGCPASYLALPSSMEETA